VSDDTEYNERTEAVFEALELALDEVDSDLDYECGGGVLTVTFANGTTMVFSRQPPVRQLWLAARSGGFHFEYDQQANDWRNTRDDQLFRPFVVRLMREQGEVEFHWL
jgi:CyaY protein